MRIPSDFNGENLYRRRNEPNDGDLGSKNLRQSPISRRASRLERTSATRRVLRLVVGLVLVLFLMRHAARPEIYQTFFAEPMQMVPTGMTGGGAIVAPESFAQTSSSWIPSDERSRYDLYSKNSTQFRDAVRLVELMSADEAQATLAASPNGLRVDVAELLAQHIEKLVESLDPLEASASDWLDFAKQLRSGSGNFASDVSGNKNRQLFAAIRFAALDAALRRVVDGSVWRSSDLDAFYGAMVQRDLIASIEHVRTGVLPMLQQPEVYRGKGVTVVGKVVRGEQLDATSNSMGVAQYWQLWLRPSDGSERPIVAVVTELPAQLAVKLTPENDAELIPLSKATTVQVDGLYLKRLAYRSSEGAELAPVVVGVVAAMSGLTAPNAVAPASAGTPASAEPAEPIESMDGSSLLMLVLTVVLGFAIAAFVMIRTQRENARMRLLRSQQQSETISLPQLLDPAEDAEENPNDD